MSKDKELARLQKERISCMNRYTELMHYKKTAINIIDELLLSTQIERLSSYIHIVDERIARRTK